MVTLVPLISGDWRIGGVTSMSMLITCLLIIIYGLLRKMTALPARFRLSLLLLMVIISLRSSLARTLTWFLWL